MSIVYIKPNMNVGVALRNIADEYDNGEFGHDEECTIIIGAHVFHCGTINDERAAEQAIFNMTFGIHKLMNKALEVDDD